MILRCRKCDRLFPDVQTFEQVAIIQRMECECGGFHVLVGGI
jgi:hypothetical protein